MSRKEAVRMVEAGDGEGEGLGLILRLHAWLHTVMAVTPAASFGGKSIFFLTQYLVPLANG